MKFAFSTAPVYQRHESPVDHVERPERLAAVLQALAGKAFASPLTPFEGRPATDEELLLCHNPSVLERVAEVTRAGGGHLDADTFVNEHSDQAARLAIGTLIDMCRGVLSGDWDRGFVAARPPGHHATPERSMGFCLYSSVAIAAKACADLAERVLIFDWDVHHGNGTQDCLYDHGGTSFISMHQSPFYPGSGYADERGEGEGEGSIYNLALPAGCGDAEYLSSYTRVVRPIIRQYDPQLIIVSAGFDAHKKDLLGGMNVTREGFAQLAAWVAEDAEATSAKGRLVGFLEGGYHLGGLAESVLATLQVWTGGEHELYRPKERAQDSLLRRLSELTARFDLPVEN